METPVLDLDVDLQVQVLVPNILVGAAKVELGKESAEDSLNRLQLMRQLRLCSRAWKAVVDNNIEYNALRLAEFDCKTWPFDWDAKVISREMFVVTQFEDNMAVFKKSRHITTRISKKIIQANLGDLTLRKLNELRDVLERAKDDMEVLGDVMPTSAQYWTCPTDRV